MAALFKQDSVKTKSAPPLHRIVLLPFGQSKAVRSQHCQSCISLCISRLYTAYTESPLSGPSLLLITMCCAERTEQDRVAQPVDDAVSSPGAYLALGLLYTVAALPAIVAPQAVSSGCMLKHACAFLLGLVRGLR